MLLLLLCASVAAGLRLQRCELVRILREEGFRESLVPDWVCLAEAVSDRVTDKKSENSEDGSTLWGIFQISDRYHCTTEGNAGKFCNIKCDDLVNDDIRDDVRCVRKVYGMGGFKQWAQWSQSCAGRPPPPLRQCTQGFPPYWYRRPG